MGLGTTRRHVLEHERRQGRSYGDRRAGLIDETNRRQADYCAAATRSASERNSFAMVSVGDAGLREDRALYEGWGFAGEEKGILRTAVVRERAGARQYDLVRKLPASEFESGCWLECPIS